MQYWAISSLMAPHFVQNRVTLLRTPARFITGLIAIQPGRKPESAAWLVS
jgi:hypothetical protein